MREDVVRPWRINSQPASTRCRIEASAPTARLVFLEIFMLQRDFQDWRERLTKFLSDKHKTRKAIGVLLIFLGLLALMTPLTPGSWLAFIGLEFLGVRFFAADKIKEWLKRKRKL